MEEGVRPGSHAVPLPSSRRGSSFDGEMAIEAADCGAAVGFAFRGALGLSALFRPGRRHAVDSAETGNEHRQGAQGDAPSRASVAAPVAAPSRTKELLRAAQLYWRQSKQAVLSHPEQKQEPLAELDTQSLELPAEDAGMHERWHEVLAGREPDGVPESELRWLVDTGTPLKHRHALWQRWWSQPHLGIIEELQDGAEEEPAKQIDYDLGRTLPTLLCERGRAALRRVLRAYAAKRPEIGYCQGMSFLAAVPLLLGFDEEAALSCLHFILESVCPGYHGPRLDGYFVDVAVLRTLVSYLLPEIHIELETFGVPMQLLATDHMLTLSVRTWPLHATVRLWDVVLMEGSPAVLASFLATLKMYFSDALTYVTSGSCQDSVGVPADVAFQFRELTRLHAAHDIDEIVNQTRKFIPLVRGGDLVEGNSTRGAGEFLEWLRERIVEAGDL